MHLLVKSIAAMLFLFVFQSSAAAVICRAPDVEGFEEAAVRATGIIGNRITKKKENIKIYIEQNDEGYWYHSNFLTKAPAGETYFPTKIGQKEPEPQEWMFWYILNDKHPPNRRIDLDLKSQLNDLYKEEVDLYLDIGLVGRDGKPKIDIGVPRSITIVDGQNQKTISADVSTLTTLKPPPSLIRRIAGCCLFGIPPQISHSFMSALKARKISKHQVKIAALVHDSATIAPIRSSKILSKADVAPNLSQIKTEAHIREMLEKSRGNTLVLVSHVERGNYVIRGPGNEIQFEIPIDRMRKIARELDVDLVDLGCETAKQMRHDTLGIGVVEPFRTDIAIRKIETALERANNFADFFEILTADGMKVVISEATVEGLWTKQSAKVFSKISDSDTFHKVAELFVSSKDRRNWFKRAVGWE